MTVSVDPSELEPPAPPATAEDAWRQLIDETLDQLEQWQLYLDDPSTDTLPVGGLPPIPVGQVPAGQLAAIEDITVRVARLHDRLGIRVDEVGAEIEHVRKARTAAHTYTT